MPISERLNSNRPDRLFVPLATEPYHWFLSGAKRWELRRKGRQYTGRHVRIGRRVELRRGYSSAKDALWGVIDDIAEAESIRAFFKRVPFSEVIPFALSEEEAASMAASILGIDPDASQGVIGFRVSLDR